MSLDELLKILGPGGVPPLVLFIFALYRKFVVLGWQYDLMVEDRNYWREQATKAANTNERAVTVAEKVTHP